MSYFLRPATVKPYSSTPQLLQENHPAAADFPETSSLDLCLFGWFCLWLGGVYACMHSGKGEERRRKKEMVWGEGRLLRRRKSSRAFFSLFIFQLKAQAPLSVSCLLYFFMLFLLFKRWE